MIFLSFVDFKTASKQNCIYKLSSDNKILSSLIKKRAVHALFKITSVKQMSNNYAPFFSRIDFVVIPSNIELT